MNPAPRSAAGRAAPLALAVLLAAAIAHARAHGDDVHRAPDRCEACHTADAATLHADPAPAARLLAPDLEARCAACHGDEGPSHETGIPPKPPACVRVIFVGLSSLRCSINRGSTFVPSLTRDLSVSEETFGC